MVLRARRTGAGDDLPERSCRGARGGAFRRGDEGGHSNRSDHAGSIARAYVLMIPADLHKAPADKSPHRTARLASWPIDQPRPPDAAISAAADLIANAAAPVLIAGGGIHASDASAALLRFAEAAAIPVTTTNMGKGAIAETHPLAAGPIASLTGPGSLGRHTRSLVTNADLVLL